MATSPSPPAWADDRPGMLRLVGFGLGSLIVHLLPVGAAVRDAARVHTEVSAPPESVSDRLRFVGETFEVEAERPEPDAGESSSDAEPPAAAPAEPPAATTPPAATAPAPVEPTSPGAPPAAPHTPTKSPSDKTPQEAPQPASSTPGEAAPPSSSSASAAAGAFGEAGAETPTVQLRRAFVKTLPLAARGDDAWLELPIGSTFEGTFVLRVDEGGRLDEVTSLGGADNPLSRAAIKNRLFLRSGVFQVREAGRGELRLRIRARVEQHAPLGTGDSEDEAGAVLVTAIGMRIDPSSKSAPPTGAYFTYGSGRHVELEVSEIER